MGNNNGVRAQVRQCMGTENAEYRKYCSGWKSIQQMKEIWRELDFNGNGYVSLAEIDKMVVEDQGRGGKNRFPGMNNKPALIRCYKATCAGDGNNDDYVERREFRALLRNLFYFTKLWNVFDDIDTEDDRRVNVNEFIAFGGNNSLGINMDEATARTVFHDMDVDNGGEVLFNEFCKYVADAGDTMNHHDREFRDFEKVEKHKAPPGRKRKPAGKRRANRFGSSKAKIAHQESRFDQTEKAIKNIRKNRQELARTWRALDFNGNNKVSLAEIDKWVSSTYPVMDNKPAMMRAYKKTCYKDGDGDPWVEKHEFQALLGNLLYFTKVWDVFDDIDTGHDRRIDVGEFTRGIVRLGMKSMDITKAVKEFDRIDTNGGGQILFDEFCKWVATVKDKMDGIKVTGDTGKLDGGGYAK